jgi:hypothetical protein
LPARANANIIGRIGDHVTIEDQEDYFLTAESTSTNNQMKIRGGNFATAAKAPRIVPRGATCKPAIVGGLRTQATLGNNRIEQRAAIALGSATELTLKQSIGHGVARCSHGKDILGLCPKSSHDVERNAGNGQLFARGAIFFPR